MKVFSNVFMSLKSIVAISFGGMVLASCSNGMGDAPGSLQEYQQQVYNSAFADEFGTPATNQNWGFGTFNVVEATEPIGSWEYMNSLSASRTRSEAESTTMIKNTAVYQTFDDVIAAGEAKCYFYLRVDNKIVLQETNKVQGNDKALYYPQAGKLDNGVDDHYFITDNEGLIDAKKLDQMANVRNNGVSYASTDQPIPDDLFIKTPSFKTMAMHVPDHVKADIAGSVENFENNFKVFWYVAKWQGNGDKRIHVDGIVVPKDQITVNVPEYKKRIIVEDLKGNINEKTKVNSSDFDFNDVVFDAVTWKINGKNHLKIIVRAAGGKLPIYVAGKEVHEGIGYMFNTSNPNYDYAKVLVQDSIIGTDASTFDFNTIPVVVIVDGEKTTAGSNIGQAPEKIAVGLDYKWCKERENIKTVYPRFSEYVTNKEITNWWKDEE